MKFRNWIETKERQIDEINRGLQRQFRQQNSHVPVGVMKDIEHQRLGNMWRKSQPFMQSNSTADTTRMNNANTDTAIYTQPQPQIGVGMQSDPNAATIAMPQQMNNSDHDSVSSMMNDTNIKSITDASWEQKPRVIEVSPMSFDERTMTLFQYTRFGFQTSGEIDKQRHARAARFVQERGEKNQPVIVLQLPDGRFSLQEGFHRTMQYLLSGAPREDWFKLKSGESVSSIDLSKWRPVRLRAYVGHPDNKRQRLQRPVANQQI